MAEISSQDAAALTAALLKNAKAVTDQGSMGAGTEVLSRGKGDPVMSKAQKDREKEEQKLADKIIARMKKSTNAYVAAQAKTGMSLKAIRELQERHSRGRVKDYIKQRAQWRAAGVSQDEQIKKTIALNFAEEDLEKKGRELVDTFDDLQVSSGNLEDQMDKQKGVGGRLTKVWAVLVAGAKELYDVQTTAMRVGREATLDQAWQSRMMGMSHVELLETQSRYRKGMESGGESQEQFTQRMLDSSTALYKWTGSLKAGAVFQAEAVQRFRRLNGAGGDLESYLTKNAQTFKILNQTLGKTSDQFNEMVNQLAESSSIRLQMFKMDRGRRSAYLQEMVALQAKLEMEGMTQEQAARTVEALAEIGGKDPKERMKEAAKLQALMGSMGMGQQGAEAAALIRGGMRGEGDADKLKELMGPVMANISQTLAQGGSAEMGMSARISALGLDPLISSMQDVELERAKVEVAPELQAPFWKTAFEWYERIETALSGPLGVIAGVIGASFLPKLGKMMSGIWSGAKNIASRLSTAVRGGASGMWQGAKNFIGKGVQGARGMAGNAWRGLQGQAGNIMSGARNFGARALPYMARTGAALAGSTTAAVAGAGAVGYGIGTAGMKGFELLDPEGYRDFGDAVGGTIAGIVDTSFGDTMERTADYWGSMLMGIFDKEENAVVNAIQTQNQLTQQQTRELSMSGEKQRDAINNQTASGAANQRYLTLAAPNRSGN